VLSGEERDKGVYECERTAAATPRARIVIPECPSRIRQGPIMKTVALCENVGESLWLSNQEGSRGVRDVRCEASRP
jgi:hypothetical protein